MLNIVLVEPEIHPNTGNIARLCAATRSNLHIVGATGFRLDERAIKRAGLDYWNEVNIQRHFDIEDLYKVIPKSRFLYFTTKSQKLYTDLRYHADDCLVFGPETRGLSDSLLHANSEWCLSIPMSNKNVRSLNLSTSVGIVLYEAIRQINEPKRQ